MDVILPECAHKKISQSELYDTYKIFFATLVSKPRIKIVNFLKSGEKNVSEIIKELDLPQTQVSHNLARLKKCGFVNSKVDGKFRVYSLNKKTITPLMGLIENHMSKYCIHILRGRGGIK